MDARDAMKETALLTTKQAAPLLSLSAGTLVTYIHRGTIKATRMGRDWFISQQEIGSYNQYRRPRGNPNFAKNKGQKSQKNGSMTVPTPDATSLS